MPIGDLSANEQTIYVGPGVHYVQIPTIANESINIYNEKYDLLQEVICQSNTVKVGESYYDHDRGMTYHVRYAPMYDMHTGEQISPTLEFDHSEEDLPD